MCHLFYLYYQINSHIFYCFSNYNTFYVSSYCYCIVLSILYVLLNLYTLNYTLYFRYIHPLLGYQISIKFASNNLLSISIFLLSNLYILIPYYYFYAISIIQIYVPFYSPYLLVSSLMHTILELWFNCTILLYCIKFILFTVILFYIG